MSLRSARRNLIAVLLLSGVSAVHGVGQIADGTGRASSAMVFGTLGGENTDLPAYADNALGFDLGASYQPHALEGAEFRVNAYPFSARYVQMSFTGGYRIAKRTAFGFLYQPFVYFGGGWARSQDKGLNNASYPPTWQPCWQTDIGLDRTYRNFAWRMVQASLRETYAPLNRLRSIGLSTGVVYHFQH
jgi:hypothetical protein